MHPFTGVPPRIEPRSRRVSGQYRRAMVRQLLPGMLLPGTIYFSAALLLHLGVVASLACASAVPVVDVLSRVLRRRPPTIASVLFVLIAGFSVSLAFVSGSPMFILLKGAVLSAILGVAFAVSAAIN